MPDFGLFSLLLLGFTLGLRHGIDWDHIAAITDITGSVVTIGPGRRQRKWQKGFFLATMYAAGHALLVVVLGLIAVWVGAILPDWLDPIMERCVGVTLIVLGVWIIYSICRDGRSFQMKSRWMLVYSVIDRGWAKLRSKITRQPIQHSHPVDYGAKTAFGIGLIHGIGAETGSQAVLLATTAGATTKLTASLLLLSFTIGLVLSNSIVAAFSLTGFVSASMRRNLYVLAGGMASLFSLLVGCFFVTGFGTALPDWQAVVNYSLR